MNTIARQVYQHNSVGRLDSFPEEIILLPTMRCNYSCLTCTQDHDDPRQYPESFLEELRHILPFAKFVNITGGEPLLYPHFDRLISIIRSCDCDYWLVTNASLLTRRWVDKLLDGPLKTIKFSIDGGTAQDYAKIRVVGNFYKVLKNIAGFMVQRLEQNRLDIHTQFNFVALRDNIESLPKLVGLAGELGIQQINVIYCVCGTDHMAERSLYFHQDLSDEKMILAREMGKRLGVDVMLPRLFNSAAPEEPSWLNARTCDFPFKFMAVELDGSIGVCCGTHVRKGNIFNNGFFATWNDPLWVKLRERVNTENETEICKNCTLCKQRPDLLASHIPDAALAARALAKHGASVVRTTPTSEHSV
jgi:Predicted Fe-S oxidoreductases